jgi:hypothetical protein
MTEWSDDFGWALGSELESIWIEGIRFGSDRIDFTWVPEDYYLYGHGNCSIPVALVSIRVPGVDLDIDSDNNGYINTDQNLVRMDAEDTMEETHAKRITWINPALDPNHASRYIPIRLSISNARPTDFYSIHYTPNLKVYKHFTDADPIPSNYKFSVNTLANHQETIFWVKAVGAGDTGFPSGFDKIHLVLWDSVESADNNGKKLARDTISLAVPDNHAQFTEWVVPNDWTIAATSISTPHPSLHAEGPQTEGTGTGDQFGNPAYGGYNNGDAYTVDTFPNGFELKVEYSLGDEYVQIDKGPRDEFAIIGTDDTKVSFVANSGIKIGPVDDPSRHEIAIIDLAGWLDLTSGVEGLSIVGDTVMLEQNPAQGYRDEEVSRLLPGMLYKGEHKSGTGVDWRGLFDAHGIERSIENWTAEDYRAIIKQTRDWWAWEAEMIVVANPNANDGIIKVYMKMNSSHPMIEDPSTISHADETQYKLFYRTDIDRNSNPILINAETRIHVQSHWGSFVSFQQLDVTAL